MLKDEIGGHGYAHLKEYGPTLYVQIKTLKEDTEKMIEWFIENLGLWPKKYAFPHYEAPTLGLEWMNQKFDEVFFKNRTPIEKEFDL
jgi:hypothetical protein